MSNWRMLVVCGTLATLMGLMGAAEGPAPAVSTTPGGPADLSGILATLAEKDKLPGAVGAILRGDTVVALGCTGVRKTGDATPFLATDQIHMGSDTKAMTALLVGQLIDKKLVTLDTTMAAIFPKLAEKMDPAMAKVTVQNLLCHDSGLPHDIDWRSIEATRLSLPEQRVKAVEMALSKPPATPIGKYSYSNAGYTLLGAIVEAKLGKAWEDVMKENLFKPLHMASAGFGAPGTPGKVEQPWGHVLRDGKLHSTQGDNAEVMGPAGTVHCSIEDWAKFIAEIMHGMQGHPTLVTAETFKALLTPAAGQSYAAGWILANREWAGGPALTHSGSNTAWFCTVWIAPSKNYALLIATNFGGEGAGKAMDEGIGKLIGFYKQMGEGR